MKNVTHLLQALEEILIVKWVSFGGLWFCTVMDNREQECSYSSEKTPQRGQIKDKGNVDV